MSFSYDITLATAKDMVRFELGDVENTVASPALVQDEEILAMLVRFSQNAFLAAARICDKIAAVFAHQGNLKMGDLQTSGLDQATWWRQRAKELRSRGGAGPYRSDAVPDPSRLDEPEVGDDHSQPFEDRPWIGISR